MDLFSSFFWFLVTFFMLHLCNRESSPTLCYQNTFCVTICAQLFFSLFKSLYVLFVQWGLISKRKNHQHFNYHCPVELLKAALLYYAFLVGVKAIYYHSLGHLWEEWKKFPITFFFKMFLGFFTIFILIFYYEKKIKDVYDSWRYYKTLLK